MELKEYHEYEPKEPDYMYRIGLFAQMNHISVKTLRFYEEQGLLLPAHIDKESGYRYYTMGQMEQLHRIMALKEAGLKLEDIKRLNETGSEKDFLYRKKEEILSKIAELTGQLSKLEGLINGKNGALSYPVRIRKQKAVICATMEGKISSYDELFDLMPRMGQLMEEAGCECEIPEYCFTLYQDMEQKEEIRIMTCEAVTQMKEDYGELKFREFPEIEVASIYHKGSYNELSRSYKEILHFIEENGYKICGMVRENHIDGVWNKESEEEWLTEIQIPVKK